TPEALASLELLAKHYAASGGDEHLGMALNLLGKKDAKPEVAAAVINGLAAGWPANKKPPQQAAAFSIEPAVGNLLARLPAASRGRLLKLAAGWGIKDLDAQLAEITKAAFTTVANAKATDADRLAAAQQILEFRPD